MKRLAAVFLALLFILGCGHNAGRPENNLVVSRAGGSPLSGPTTGPLSSPRLTNVTEGLIAVVDDVERLRASRDEGYRELAAIASEVREEAVADIDLCLRD